MKWAHSKGAPWDAQVCAGAAERGDLEMLQWLREEQAPWDVSTCNAAAKLGHWHVYDWATKNGAPESGRSIFPRNLHQIETAIQFTNRLVQEERESLVNQPVS